MSHNSIPISLNYAFNMTKVIKIILIVLYFLLTSNYINTTSADGLFEIRLALSNSIDMDAEGNCCDGSKPIMVPTTSQASSLPSTLFSSSHVAANSNQSLLTSKCLVKCNTSFRVCLRHYERTVNFDGTCSFGEVKISPNKYEDIHQIKFNFSWPKDFSLIIEAFHDISNTARYGPAKKLLLRQAFQRSLEVSADWTDERIKANQTTITAKIRVLCDRFYYGRSCSTRCTPRNDNLGHYECGEHGIVCLPGWFGEYCTEPQCAEGCTHGTCKVPGTCDCNDGYEGEHCDQCKVYPGCVHGTCTKHWECNCIEGWGGPYCSEDLNYCTHHHPCANGAGCRNTGKGSYTCDCTKGFTGRNCDIPIADCSDSPCLNGGVCSSSPGFNYTCACPVGYIGDNCEKSISSCSWDPCQNGATCTDGPSGYLCICPPGFEGSECQIRKTHCDQSPCHNGAECKTISSPFSSFSSSVKSSYICSCRAGFNGTHCENNINDCSIAEQCFNGGTCVDGANSFTCICPPGFTGTDCGTLLASSSLSSASHSTPPSSCQPNPCLHGGSCKIYPITTTSHSKTASSSSLLIKLTATSTTTTTTTTNIIKCKCQQGYSGNFCEISNSFPFPSPDPRRAEKQLEEERSLSSSTATTDDSLNNLSKGQMALISVVLCIVLLSLICLISMKIIKRRVQAQERKRYENEEAIRQNEENSTKKCLQNNVSSCTVYNDLNRETITTPIGSSMGILSSHPHHHHHHHLSSSKLSNDDYIVNELTIDANNVNCYGRTTLPPPLSSSSTCHQISPSPSPPISKYSTLSTASIADYQQHYQSLNHHHHHHILHHHHNNMSSSNSVCPKGSTLLRTVTPTTINESKCQVVIPTTNSLRSLELSKSLNDSLLSVKCNNL